MQYSEMNDEMLAIAHMTWNHMATNELEIIDNQGGIDKASQSSLDAFDCFMQNCVSIKAEFIKRASIN
jgi:hypothetical protein